MVDILAKYNTAKNNKYILIKYTHRLAQTYHNDRENIF